MNNEYELTIHKRLSLLQDRKQKSCFKIKTKCTKFFNGRAEDHDFKQSKRFELKSKNKGKYFLEFPFEKTKVVPFLNKKERLSYAQLKKTLKFNEVKVVL